MDWTSNPTGAGNLLTASYPHMVGGTANGWVAAGKDHIVSDPSSVVVSAISIQITDSNGNNVPITQTVVQATGALAQHPTARVLMTPGYYCTGGGAIDNYGSGVGNMLTGSWPILDPTGQSVIGWQASGKDQVDADPSTITVYAIGIQVPLMNLLQQVVTSAQGAPGEISTATAIVPVGNIVVGGGAQATYTGAGNILYASYPVFQGSQTGWQAAGKAQIIQDPSGQVTAWAISFVGNVEP